MTSIGPPEETLWELPRGEGGIDATTPSDEVLHAYRAGELTEIEERRLEWLLCRSARTRSRLARLSGLALEEPRARVRRRIIDGRRWFHGRFPGAWQIAAAVLVAGSLISVTIHMKSAGPESVTVTALPGNLDFDVRVEGLAPIRSGGGLPRAYPDTPIRVAVEPRHNAVAGLEFALFSDVAGQLRRLDPGKNFTVEIHRGAAVFTTTARSLVGSTPGTYDLYVVIARKGSLPGELPRGLNGTGIENSTYLPEALVYRRSLEIVGEPIPR